MDTINQLSVVVAGLIRTGSILRFMYCMIRLQGTDTEREMYIKRSKNTVCFLIIAECIWVIKDITLHYYS